MFKCTRSIYKDDRILFEIVTNINIECKTNRQVPPAFSVSKLVAFCIHKIPSKKVAEKWREFQKWTKRGNTLCYFKIKENIAKKNKPSLITRRSIVRVYPPQPMNEYLQFQ
jgi:hypothetical protein